MSVPAAARRILNEGTLCYLGAPSPAGPHLTPVVFVLDGGRVWGTTGRATTKAKLWRREPVAGGLVGLGGRWLSFRGPVTLYDALDPSTWPASLRRGPRVAGASARFSLKNARFFAGYARDVTRVPLAWTPPARVIFSIDLSAGALLERGTVLERWGSWSGTVEGIGAFRRAERGLSGERVPEERLPEERVPEERLPEEAGELLREPGEGTLGITGEYGPVVLPARWSGSPDTLYARVPAEILSLAGVRRGTPASLVVDRASGWRAAKMRGVLLRGPSACYLPDALTTGRAELEKDAGELSAGEAVISIRPRSAVWWSGWTSGTVKRP